MRIIETLIAVMSLFALIIFGIVFNTIDTMSSSEQARIADMGDSIQEAAETAAINVLERNLNDDLKARGVAVIDDTCNKYHREVLGCIEGEKITSEDQIKRSIRTQIINEWTEYLNKFNRKITIPSRGKVNIFDAKFENYNPDNVFLGNFEVAQGTDIEGNRRYVNQTGGVGTAFDKNTVHNGNYPYFKTRIRIKFYSTILTNNASVDKKTGQITPKPHYDLEYPLRATIRHVNTEDQEYKDNNNFIFN